MIAIASSPIAPVRRGALTACLVAAACSVPPTRSGPPFAAAFPDATELVTTTDPAAVRRQLDHVQLPSDDAHHELLLALLRSRERIDAPHLVLLARAVARPDHVVAVADGRVWRYGARGDGGNAAVVEQLLVAGLDRLGDVDRRWFGELLAVTQSDATLQRYADRLLPGLDDGSTTALGEILDGMHGSPALVPFLTGYLAPRGGLDGDRGWFAFGHVSFDSERLAVLRAAVARQPLDGDRMVAAMRAFSFDSSREQAFALLAARVPALSSDDVHASLATFSFDNGRAAACAALGEQPAVALGERHLVAIVDLCSFDSGRLACVHALAPRLTGAPDGDAACALLREFAFDHDRLRALDLLAPRWRELAAAQRTALLDTFTFASGRRGATELLLR